MTFLASCSLQLHSPDLSWEVILIAVGLTGHVIGQPLNACEQALLEVSDKYGLSQHVHSPTRPSSGRLLDLVFAAHPTVIQACHVVPGISDHDAVLFEVNVSPTCPPKPRKIHLSSFATTYLDSDPVNRSVDENWNIIARV